MKTSTQKPSVTPILDLLQPLPQADTERVNGRFAFPFLTAVTAVVLTGNLSFFPVLFSFIFVNFLTIAIHEFGHLVAGWCVGLRFKGVRIDPLRIRVDSGRWRFKVCPRLSWGFALMSLERVRRVRARLIIFTAGGPAASILCGITAVVVGEIGLARYDSPWAAFLDFLGAWSLVIGFVGLVPFRVRGFANDAMLLRALLFSKPQATQLVASYALSTLKGNSLFFPDYVPRWFRLASAETKLQIDNYFANWLGYEAAEDQETAGQFLERCLAASALMDDDARDKLIAEAVVFTAWRRDDAAKAQVWLKRMKSLDHLHLLWRTRIEIALLCAQKQFENALTAVDLGLSLIREAPNSSERQRCEAGWVSWKQQIEQRLPVAVAASGPCLTTSG